MFDPTVGYAEFYLAKKQIEQGLKVLVLALDESSYKNKRQDLGFQQIEGIKIYYLKSLLGFRGFAWPSKLRELRFLVKNFNPDIVHCHGLLTPLSQEILLLKPSGKYKVVGDVITGISPLTSIFLPKIKFLFNSLVSSKVEAFFACNKAVKDFLTISLNIPQKKVHLIPLAADHELFKPDNSRRKKTRNSLGLSTEDFVAIYTGKFLPSKRIDDLLIASKPVINEYRQFKILLVGDGPEHYKEKLKSIIGELGITKNVLIIKSVHRKELPNFYNAADFAVWPGAFSISIVEAMACGLPIIIAKSDWTSHYLEYENGYSFKAGDVHKLSSLLLTLVKDDETRRLMGTKSRKLVEDKLNWDTVATKYLEVYKSIMS